MKLVTIFFIIFSGLFVNAQKVTFMGGIYSLKASADAASVTLSKPGIYAVSGAFPIMEHVEYNIGYTLFMSKTISGDMGYGPDLSINYFPFQKPTGDHINFHEINYSNLDKHRFFLQGSFHQRQFQSVQSPYSGFGAGIGWEYQVFENYAAYSLVRYQVHSGPNNANLKQLDVLVGIQFQFFK